MLPVDDGRYLGAKPSFDRADAYAWLPLLMDEKQRQIAAYESALPHASTANAGVRDELQTLLAENRQHLQQLQAI